VESGFEGNSCFGSVHELAGEHVDVDLGPGLEELFDRGSVLASIVDSREASGHWWLRPRGLKSVVQIRTDPRCNKGEKSGASRDIFGRHAHELDKGDVENAHDYLVKQGVREACEIALVLPLGSPVPPSPDTSRALVAAFAERDIKFVPNRRVASVDTARNVAVLDDGAEMPFDLFLGVPKHRVPPVVLEIPMSENGWIPVNPRTLETRYETVYAVGDCANTGAPKAGVFAEGAARAVASALIAKLRGKGAGALYDGFRACYIEFGGGRVGKVEVDFFSGPAPIGTYYEPSVAHSRRQGGVWFEPAVTLVGFVKRPCASRYARFGRSPSTPARA
jgi:hypothetical protein